MALFGCNQAKDALELADGPDRQPIDRSLLGINAFFNDSRFGSFSAQSSDIRDNLKISRLRILLRWDTGSQPTPGSTPVFPLFDEIINASEGSDILIVTTGVPSWMQNEGNWIGGNPRTTFIEKWFKPLVQHVKGHGNVRAIQVWNEPNNPSFSENSTLGVLTSGANYVELLAGAKNVIDSEAPSIKLLNAATTAINQNFPETLNYNKDMRDAGADSLVDVWAVHYYGQQFENLIRNDGVSDFLNGISAPIWVTESGAQGINNQLKYGEETWHYIKEKVPGIERIYIYQYADASAPEVTYGLKTLNNVSDLYVWLRDG